MMSCVILAADILRDRVTLIFDLLTLDSVHALLASHVIDINLYIKLEDPRALRSSVISHDISHRLLLTLH